MPWDYGWHMGWMMTWWSITWMLIVLGMIWIVLRRSAAGQTDSPAEPGEARYQPRTGWGTLKRPVASRAVAIVTLPVTLGGRLVSLL